MTRFRCVANGLVLGMLLFSVQACQQAGHEVSTKSARMEPQEIHRGPDIIRPESPDGFIEIISRENIDSLGGFITRQHVMNPRAKGAPCPCCPDWRARTLNKSVEGDSVPPGCCDPCFGTGFTKYANDKNQKELAAASEDLLTLAHNFDFPGVIIAEVAVKLSRTPQAEGDSAGVAFALAMSGGAEQPAPDVREKSWRLARTGDTYWLRFREEFKVEAGAATFTLTGSSQMASGDVAGARVVHLSYFPDFN